LAAKDVSAGYGQEGKESHPRVEQPAAGKTQHKRSAEENQVGSDRNHSVTGGE
jgi:hypothetical protein